MSAQFLCPVLTCHLLAAFPLHLRVETLPSVASGKWQAAERAFKWKLPTPAAQFNFCCCGCLPAWPFSFNLLGPFLLLVRFSLSFNQLLNIAFGLRCLVFGVWLLAFDFQLSTFSCDFCFQLAASSSYLLSHSMGSQG